MSKKTNIPINIIFLFILFYIYKQMLKVFKKFQDIYHPIT